MYTKARNFILPQPAQTYSSQYISDLDRVIAVQTLVVTIASSRYGKWKSCFTVGVAGTHGCSSSVNRAGDCRWRRRQSLTGCRAELERMNVALLMLAPALEHKRYRPNWSAVNAADLWSARYHSATDRWSQSRASTCDWVHEVIKNRQAATTWPCWSTTSDPRDRDRDADNTHRVGPACLRSYTTDDATSIRWWKRAGGMLIELQKYITAVSNDNTAFHLSYFFRSVITKCSSVQRKFRLTLQYTD